MFTHVNMVKKYINTSVKMVLYPEKVPMFACSNGYRKGYSLGHWDVKGAESWNNRGGWAWLPAHWLDHGSQGMSEA